MVESAVPIDLRGAVPAVIDIPFSSDRAIANALVEILGPDVILQASLGQAGVPNRNGDVFTPEALEDIRAWGRNELLHDERTEIMRSGPVSVGVAAGAHEFTVPWPGDGETPLSVGSIIQEHGRRYVITGLDPEAQYITIRPAAEENDLSEITDVTQEPSRIRGLRSNVVMIDDEMTLSADEVRQVNAAIFNNLVRVPSPYEFMPPPPTNWGPCQDQNIPQHHRFRSSMHNWMRLVERAQCTPSRRTAHRRASNEINAFTRTRMREDGFFRRILPPVPISNDELDRAVPTDRPVRVVDREEAAAQLAEEQPLNQSAAISIPFAALPLNQYIRGPRYRVSLPTRPQPERMRARWSLTINDCIRAIRWRRPITGLESLGRIVTPRFRREIRF